MKNTRIAAVHVHPPVRISAKTKCVLTNVFRDASAQKDLSETRRVNVLSPKNAHKVRNEF
ncbi:unnamed protein product [Larinioides sclopetarius]|uniref:Ribosomal protein S17 n=1 Tax=Larinioides sclopetarius TaxID=280406 RepID=A0AAV1Z5C7_9ARAC